MESQAISQQRVVLRHRAFVPWTMAFYCHSTLLTMFAGALGTVIFLIATAKKAGGRLPTTANDTLFLICLATTVLLWLIHTRQLLSYFGLVLAIKPTAIEWHHNSLVRQFLRGTHESFVLRVQGKAFAPTNGRAEGSMILLAYGKRRIRYFLVVDSAKTGSMIRLSLNSWSLLVAPKSASSMRLPRELNGLPLPTDMQQVSVIQALLQIGIELRVQHRDQSFLGHTIKTVGMLTAADCLIE